MNISRRFIEYPVMTTLLMAALLIFGVFGYSQLPNSELPNVDFPTIQVSANLAGADPETMASAIAAPLENAFSTVPGIDPDDVAPARWARPRSPCNSSWTGTSTRRRRTCRPRSAAATRQLPKTMINPPTYRKVNPADQPIFFLVLTSKTLPITTVEQYANLLSRQLSTLDGVAQVPVSGASKYAVRIQADPNALAARGIGIDTLASAIDDANVNQATGALNGASDAQIIHTDGQLDNADEIPQPDHRLQQWRAGAAGRCRQCDRQSSANMRQADWYRTQRAVSVWVQRQPGANTIEVVKQIREHAAAVPGHAARRHRPGSPP